LLLFTLLLLLLATLLLPGLARATLVVLGHCQWGRKPDGNGGAENATADARRATENLEDRFALGHVAAPSLGGWDVGLTSRETRGMHGSSPQADERPSRRKRAARDKAKARPTRELAMKTATFRGALRPHH